MALVLKSPGIQVSVKDFTQYSVNLLGNNVLVPFVSLKGPINKPTIIGSAEEFIKVFGIPITDSAFAAYMISKFSSIVAVRLAAIYEKQTLNKEDGNIGKYLFNQFNDEDDFSAINALKLRNGAFVIYRFDETNYYNFITGYVYDGDSENPGLNPGSWAKDLEVYLVPETFTRTNNYIDTCSFYVVLNDVVVESFTGLEIWTSYEESENNIERVINNSSKYIKISKIDYTKLRTITKAILEDQNNTFKGIVYNDLTNCSPTNCDPKEFNLLDIEKESPDNYNPSKLTDFDDIFKETTLYIDLNTSFSTLPLFINTFSYLTTTSLLDEFIEFNIFYTDLAKNSTNELKTIYENLITLADNKWFFSFVNIPLSKTTPKDAADWVSTNYSSFWRAATYWPSAKYYNTFIGRTIEMGTSFTGVLTALVNDIYNYPWFASAGLNRGIASQARALTYNPNKSERDLLYYYPNRINPIRKIPNQGIVVWGNKTLQTKPSALDSINVARLFVYLANVVNNSVQYLIFEPITNDLFIRFKELLTPVLEEVRTQKGLYDYVIVADMNAGGNTPETIQRKEVHVAIGVKPTLAAEFIYVDFIVTPTGADFADYIR